MKTFEKGNITELQVQLELVKRGYLVFTPVNDGSFVDLVVKLDGGYKSVQVKTALKKPTGFMLHLYSSAGGGKKKFYSSETLDYFGTFFDNRLFLIPVKDVEGRNTVTFRTREDYRSEIKLFSAREYEIK